MENLKSFPGTPHLSFKDIPSVSWLPSISLTTCVGHLYSSVTSSYGFVQTKAPQVTAHTPVTTSTWSEGSSQSQIEWSQPSGALLQNWDLLTHCPIISWHLNCQLSQMPPGIYFYSKSLPKRSKSYIAENLGAPNPFRHGSMLGGTQAQPEKLWKWEILIIEPYHNIPTYHTKTSVKSWDPLKDLQIKCVKNACHQLKNPDVVHFQFSHFQKKKTFVAIWKMWFPSSWPPTSTVAPREGIACTEVPTVTRLMTRFFSAAGILSFNSRSHHPKQMVESRNRSFLFGFQLRDEGVGIKPPLDKHNLWNWSSSFNLIILSFNKNKRTEIISCWHLAAKPPLETDQFVAVWSWSHREWWFVHPRHLGKKTWTSSGNTNGCFDLYHIAKKRRASDHMQASPQPFWYKICKIKTLSTIFQNWFFKFHPLLSLLSFPSLSQNFPTKNLQKIFEKFSAQKFQFKNFQKFRSKISLGGIPNSRSTYIAVSCALAFSISNLHMGALFCS